MGHGGRLTLAGIIVGIGGALVASRLMRGALFDVDPADPLIYLALSLVLLAVAGTMIKPSTSVLVDRRMAPS